MNIVCVQNVVNGYYKKINNMAWLNLNHDLQYDFDEMLVAMCEVPEDEIFYHPLGGFPLEVVDCDMPFRSGMENDRHWWGYRGSERTKHGLNTWMFKDYVIEKNVGKSFSQAFSYFCKFVSRQYQKYFLESFQNYSDPGRYGAYYEKYWIDDNDIIQESKTNKEKTDVVFMSDDYTETWLIQVIDTPFWSKKPQPYEIVRTLKRGNMHPVRMEFRGNVKLNPIKIQSTEGIKEIFKNRKSHLYQRLRHEDNARYRKKQREEERKKKEIVYSFLTREEKELREARKLDQYNLYRHGFNDESFKGKPYHGRKNKSKKQRRADEELQRRLSTSF